MTLLERIAARQCAEDGCRRAPMSQSTNRCADHRLRWTPGQSVSPWVQRIREGQGVAKEISR